MLNGKVTMFDLKQDQATDTEIDNSMRLSIQSRGTNLWVLMFAMLLASIGLNVNSTAVIIGAMLVSPIMAPIIAIGYATGIQDPHLIRKSFRTLIIFFGISLLSSTVYFSLSPLDVAHSELLARTSPTIWDVLIALFGGAAGIIGLTRKSTSTVIPGVAIATALMPPICTAGYGIANGETSFFFGSLYLFTINAVFIAIASLIFTKILKLPGQHESTAKMEQRSKIIITIIVILTLFPSGYLAMLMVQEEVFVQESQGILKSIKQNSDVIIIDHEINRKERILNISFLGDYQVESILHSNFPTLPSYVKTKFVRVDRFQNETQNQQLQITKQALLKLEENQKQITENENNKNQKISWTTNILQTEKELISLFPFLIAPIIFSDIKSEITLVVLPFKTSVSDSKKIKSFLTTKNFNNLRIIQNKMEK